MPLLRTHHTQYTQAIRTAFSNDGIFFFNGGGRKGYDPTCTATRKHTVVSLYALCLKTGLVMSIFCCVNPLSAIPRYNTRQTRHTSLDYWGSVYRIVVVAQRSERGRKVQVVSLGSRLARTGVYLPMQYVPVGFSRMRLHSNPTRYSLTCPTCIVLQTIRIYFVLRTMYRLYSSTVYHIMNREIN